MATLQVNWRQSWRLITGVIISLMVIGVMIEGVLHAASLPDDFPPPSIGTNYQRFEVQLARLDHFAETHNGVDCIFIGSSLVEKGIDPVYFGEVYQAETGSTSAPNCFNFGLGSISTSTLGVVVDLLIKMYEPDLFVIGTQARAYNEPQMLNRTYYVYAAEHTLPDNAWLRYQRGDANVTGWLIEHSELYQTILTTRLLLQRDGRGYAFESLAQELDSTTTGHVKLSGSLLDVSQPINYDDPHTEDERLMDFLQTYIVADNDLKGLQGVVELHNQPTQILIVEMPVHHTYTGYFLEGEDRYDWFVDAVTQTVAGSDVMFWRTVPDFANSLPDSAWYDRYHMNSQGAVTFTAWLAERVATSVANGNLNPLVDS